MPNWFIGVAHSSGVTWLAGAGARLCPPIGWLEECPGYVLARGSYTWSRLRVYVSANTITSNCDVRSYINGGNGNQVVTIGAGLTGVFEDNVNSDALVNGDLFETRVFVGAGGTSIIFRQVSWLLQAATDIPILACSGSQPGSVAAGQTKSFRICGSPNDGGEAECQYRIRTGAVWSNLTCYVEGNTLSQACTARTRINGGNGAQFVTIPIATTGRFEDAVNTDTINVADLANYQIVSAGGSGGMWVCMFHVKSTSIARQTGNGGDGRFYAPGFTYYAAMENTTGDQPSTINAFTSVEARCQADVEAAITVQNLYVYCNSNGGGASTVRTRKNGANGALSISIPAWFSGAFEDLVNNENYIATDLWNFQMVAGAGGGSFALSYMGVEQHQAIGGAGGASASVGAARLLV